MSDRTSSYRHRSSSNRTDQSYPSSSQPEKTRTERFASTLLPSQRGGSLGFNFDPSDKSDQSIRDNLAKDIKAKNPRANDNEVELMVARVFADADVSQERIEPQHVARLNEALKKILVEPNGGPPPSKSAAEGVQSKVWPALDEWSAAFDKDKVEKDALGFNDHRLTKTKRTDRIYEALDKDIPTKLPEYGEALHVWVRDRAIELTREEPYQIAPVDAERLKRYLETVTQWVRGKFSETDGLKIKGYRLTNPKNLDLLSRHWTAHVELNKLEALALNRGDATKDKAMPLILAAIQSLRPKGYLDRDVHHCFDAAAGGGRTIWFVSKERTLAELEERLAADPNDHWVKPDDLKFTMEVLKTAKTVKKCEEFLAKLRDKYGIDVKDISPLDFVNTGKIDTRRKLDVTIEGVYR